MASIDLKAQQAHYAVQTQLTSMYKNITLSDYRRFKCKTKVNKSNEQLLFYNFLDENKLISNNLSYMFLKYISAKIYLNTEITSKYSYGYNKRSNNFSYVTKRQKTDNFKEIIEAFLNNNKLLYAIRKRKDNLKSDKKSWLETLSDNCNEITMDTLNLDVSTKVGKAKYGPYLYCTISLHYDNSCLTSSKKKTEANLESSIKGDYNKNNDEYYSVNNPETEYGEIISDNYITRLTLVYISKSDSELVKCYNENAIINLLDKYNEFIEIPPLILQAFTHFHTDSYIIPFKDFIEKFQKIKKFKPRKFRQSLINIINCLWD
ncbi:MAG: hypothetical protein EOP34_06835 [Rickettsiales bacterium]|nr:MAG: hypothetical protein EOP34_06835 [Rickettsiales bacterium]